MTATVATAVELRPMRWWDVADAHALEVLCARHAPRVERLSRHLLRDPEDARDAAQEALAKLCVRVRQFRGEIDNKEILRRLTRAFDEVWYGERAYGAEQYRSFEQGVRALGTPPPAARPAHG